MSRGKGIGRGYWAHAGHVPADLTGQRFGRLVVLERARHYDRNGLWRCVCDCGALHVTRGDRLRSGRVTSCGRWCRAKEAACG